MAALQGKKINRVACGSAHTLAWSTSKPTNAGKLPAQVMSLLEKLVSSITSSKISVRFHRSKVTFKILFLLTLNLSDFVMVF